MIDKSIGLNNVGGAQPLEGLKKNPSNGVGTPAGVEFRKTLDGLSQAGLQGVMGSGLQAPTGTAGIGALGGAEKLKFSNHAVERMRSRGISFQPDEMKSIEGAIAKAAQKGSKDTLVLSGDNALIVSVKNNTVVTVMDRQAMKDNVFTNIDSTVVI